MSKQLKLCCTCGWSGSYDELVAKYEPDPSHPDDVVVVGRCPACLSTDELSYYVDQQEPNIIASDVVSAGNVT